MGGPFLVSHPTLTAYFPQPCSVALPCPMGLRIGAGGCGSAASAMPISGETREKEIPHGKPCCFRRTQDAVDMVNQYLSSVVYNVMRQQLNLPSKLRVIRLGMAKILDKFNGRCYH